MDKRSDLSFDGKGINGPDQYRSRVATFTSPEHAKTYGELFAAAPELLEALKGAVAWLDDLKAAAFDHCAPDGGVDNTFKDFLIDSQPPNAGIENFRKAIAKATGSA